MARKDGITYEDVAQICEKFNAEGTEITVRGVRIHTGGSNSTVLNHIDAWWEKLAERNRFDSIISTQTKTAILGEIARHVEATREGMEERVKIAEGIFAEAKILVGNADREIEGLRSQIDSLSQEQMSLLARLEAETTLAERRVDEIRQRHRDLELERNSLISDLIVARVEAAKVADLVYTNEVLRRDKADCTQRVLVAEARNEELGKQISMLQGLADDTKDGLDRKTTDLEKERQARQEAEKMVAVLEVQAAAKRKRYSRKAKADDKAA